MKNGNKYPIVLVTLSAVLAFGCSRRASREDIEHKIKMKVEAVNKTGDIGSIKDLFLSDYVVHSPGDPDIKGIDNFNQSLIEDHKGVPDGHLAIEDMVIDGNKAMVRYTWTGTHTGTFRNIPATGKKIKIEMMYLYRFENGKFAETYAIPDRMALVQQLGLFPVKK